MLTALVLICSTVTTPDLRACTRDTAVNVVQVPAQFANPTACLMHGQAYLAETEIGRELQSNERVKVICVQGRSVSANGTPAAR